jgi:hypothetical protein
MGIDSIVDLDCAPKRRLSTTGILQMLKARDRAQMVLEAVRNNGDMRPAADITFKVVLRTPEGDRPSEVAVQTLLDQAAKLDEHRSACASCPANRDQPSGYGCFHYINYPIEAATEDWLLARLPDDPESTAGQLLRRAVEDFGWRGEHAASMRHRGDTFFEAELPATRRWSDGFVVDANQIFHMLFHVGAIGSTHALMVALFFGALPHDLDPELLADAKRRSGLMSLATVAEQDGQREQLAELIRALVLAARLDVEVLIDS